MLDTVKFIERLELILNHYELSAAAFADRIAVQRSSISHLLNGRNKPSLEFVMKITEMFPEVDLRWLLFGTGIFPNTSKQEVLSEFKNTEIDKSNTLPPTIKVERITFFYADGTFKNYLPEKN